MLSLQARAYPDFAERIIPIRRSYNPNLPVTARSQAAGQVANASALAADRFAAGIVLYDGEDTVPVGERLWAVPLCALWSTGARRLRMPETPGNR